ncbi:MAG: PLP-dependent aminotransferase family protein [Actinomycetota bacterium]|nr:PLP-dependent aminotransferase family protein [Actinomycetota bacterium]
MDLRLSLDGRVDLAGQIYRQIRAIILGGRLTRGQMLPPSRDLAKLLGVSRNTVTAAYDQLTAQGFATGRVGAGTFVSNELSLRKQSSAAVRTAKLTPRSVWTDLPVSEHTTAPGAEFDFRAGVPDASLFPYQSWRRLMSEELRGHRVRSGVYGEPSGDPRLRAAVAGYLAVSRSITADPRDILITNGTQQAADLLARVLIEAGDCVAVEDPGYQPPRMLFESLGAEVVGVPVDSDGIVVDAIPNRAKLVYVTPSHQYPLGVALSLRRRIALVDWAARRNAVIMEDDYDTAFADAGKALEPLHTLDRDGRVIYVGSFSKVMLPTLRLGFLVAPPALREPLRSAKFVTDWHTALPGQLALAGFIEEGGLARHVRKMARIYRVRRDVIRTVIGEELHPWLEPISSAGGMHVSALMPRATVAQVHDVVACARDRGVAVWPLSDLSLSNPRAGLILGCGLIDAQRIHEGLARLRLCLADVLGDG